MIEVKQLYKKLGGREKIHFVQSFSPTDKLTYKQAHEIGLKMAEYFKDFQVVVATHIDRKHIHNHIVINTVNFRTGLKFHQSKYDLQKIKDYSSDNLVYSVTLDEWTTHLGIDYKSEKTDIVKASADGKIKSIKNDPRYGLTVVIEHTNGFESVYSNLLTAEFITVGEEVKQGQTIATVGNTARFEIADETHLHFEIKQNGENVDPNIYLK